MARRFEFRATIVRMLIYALAFNVFLCCVSFFSRAGFKVEIVFSLIAIIDVVYIISIPYKPSKLIVDEEKLMLEIYYPLSALKPVRMVSLQNLDCTFDYEIGSRGGRIKNLRINLRGVNIVNISPDYNGWYEDNLLLLYRKLDELKNGTAPMRVIPILQ